jgi:aryl-alcohol dehydrogenase-like predicted oxidoreductase
VDDGVSKKALTTAFDNGITFYDTADFYGFGHSEELIGEVFSNRDDIIVATKAGHRLQPDNSIALDYSYDYLIEACEASLRRLKRETIDYYQLHSAKLSHLEQGDCLRAMDTLRAQGKIRYYGVSLNTFNPFPEAEFLINHDRASGFQLVFNIINQRAIPLLEQASHAGYGVIARMPLQFGLLTGKFDQATTFDKTDHRRFRLPPEALKRALDDLRDVWKMAERKGVSKTELSMGYILSFSEISTVIPGIKTPEQAVQNSKVVSLAEEEKQEIITLYNDKLKALMDYFEELES